MSIFQNVGVAEQIEDTSKTFFTSCRKTNIAERRRSFILLNKVVATVIDQIYFLPCNSMPAHFLSVNPVFWQQNEEKSFA